MKKIIGKKGGGGSPPTVNPGTVFSQERRDVVICTHFHSVKGLVDGPKSVFIDKVPLKDEQGIDNYENYQYQYKYGHPDDPPLPFTAQETPFDANRQEIKKSSPKTLPEITGASDYCRITVGMLIYDIPDKGGRNKAKISYRVMVKEGSGNYYVYTNKGFNEIASSEYRPPEMEIDLTKMVKPVSIRIEKTSEDSQKDTYVSKLYFVQASVGVKKSMSWPGISMMRVQAQPKGQESFGSMGFLMHQNDTVQVPSNYNETTGKYDGEWDGSWKIGCYSNPLWCLRNWLLDDINGMGEKFFGMKIRIDTQSFYEISKYWDEKVDNGLGLMEPRAEFNHYSQNDDRSAAEQLMYFLSHVNGGFYIVNNTFRIWSDIPSQPVGFAISNADLKDMQFIYSIPSVDEMVNHVTVKYNEPSKMYELRDIVYVDWEMVKEFGEKKTEFHFVGCSSKSEAMRKARAVVAESIFGAETVTFTMPVHRQFFTMASVIMICDNLRDNLDAVSGVIDYFEDDRFRPSYTYNFPGGELEYIISGEKGTYTGSCLYDGDMVILDKSIPIDIGGTFIVAPKKAKQEIGLWRVYQFQYSDDRLYVTVSAKKYDKRKYEYINEKITWGDVQEFEKPYPELKPPLNLQLIEVTPESTMDSSADVMVTWDQVAGAVSYTVQWYTSLQSSMNVGTTEANTFFIKTTAPATLHVAVIANGFSGRQGKPARGQIDVIGNFGKPSKVTGLSLVGLFTANGFSVKWDKTPRAVSYNLRIMKDGVIKRFVGNGNVTNFNYSRENMINDSSLFRRLTVEVQAVGMSGDSSDWSSLELYKPAPAVPSAIKLSTDIPKGVVITCDLGRDKDPSIEGLVVHKSDSSGFTPGQDNQIWAGDQPQYQGSFEAGKEIYFIIAAYDGFGMQELNYSSELYAKPVTVASTIEDGLLTIDKMDQAQFASSIAVFDQFLALATIPEYLPEGSIVGGWSGSCESVGSSRNTVTKIVRNGQFGLLFVVTSGHVGFFGINEKTFKVSKDDVLTLEILNYDASSAYHNTNPYRPDWLVISSSDNSKQLVLQKKSVDGDPNGESPLAPINRWVFISDPITFDADDVRLIAYAGNNKITPGVDHFTYSRMVLTKKSQAATIITPESITTPLLATGSITAEKINVTNLSAITANMGTLTTGVIQSADGGRYLNFDGSKTNLLNTPNFTIDHQGNVVGNNVKFNSGEFNGIVTAEKFISKAGGVINTADIVSDAISVGPFFNMPSDWNQTFSGCRYVYGEIHYNLTYLDNGRGDFNLIGTEMTINGADKIFRDESNGVFLKASYFNGAAVITQLVTKVIIKIFAPKSGVSFNFGTMSPIDVKCFFIGHKR